MNLDLSDIILLKNEFSKKLSGFMDKKKLQIFIEKYFLHTHIRFVQTYLG